MPKSLNRSETSDLSIHQYAHLKYTGSRIASSYAFIALYMHFKCISTGDCVPGHQGPGFVEEIERELGVNRPGYFEINGSF